MTGADFRSRQEMGSVPGSSLKVSTRGLGRWHPKAGWSETKRGDQSEDFNSALSGRESDLVDYFILLTMHRRVEPKGGRGV